MTWVYGQTWRSLETFYQQKPNLFSMLPLSSNYPTLWVSSSGANPVVILDWEETENTLVVKAKIAPISVEELEICVISDSVLIRGEKWEYVEVPGYYNFSYPAEKFESLIPLPYRIQPSAATAKIGQNILILRFPIAIAESDDSVRAEYLIHPTVAKAGDDEINLCLNTLLSCD